MVQEVLHHAQTSEDARHRPVESAGLPPLMARLREFQCERISRTYRDFTAQPQYAAAMNFFMEDLYAPRDFTQRDHDAERVHTFLKRFVPADMLKLATDAIELTRISNELDRRMLEELTALPGFRDHLTDEMYAEAYRRCNNLEDRERQIELLVGVMRDAASAAHLVLTGPALRMAKGPAHAAGWNEMFGFIERGHHAFAKVKNARPFLHAIEERETRIMDRIVRGEQDPFSD
jgi:hypothetical protein